MDNTVRFLSGLFFRVDRQGPEPQLRLRRGRAAAVAAVAMGMIAYMVHRQLQAPVLERRIEWIEPRSEMEQFSENLQRVLGPQSGVQEWQQTLHELAIQEGIVQAIFDHEPLPTLEGAQLGYMLDRFGLAELAQRLGQTARFEKGHFFDEADIFVTNIGASAERTERDWYMKLKELRGLERAQLFYLRKRYSLTTSEVARILSS